MTIDGKLIEKSDTQEVSASFKKREFVVEYAENPQYPEFLKFELIQNNCQQLDAFNVGDEMTVSFNLKGRKWTDRQGVVKYFNSLQAWRLEKKSTAAPTGGADAPPPPAASDEWMKEDFSSDDDLPF
ncbi:DUF3127 domain-containing protein [Marinoscillum furvescens]|uniref:Uncharacterized protein DUF3127 n=1 Tax=Marinoscillum furvescens DSM 4134 TaxID=1122208 RepID=A0A3D9L738_MARFU|nr:DUF3127 domain-containing protein [Marinoscillum furvescens]REE02171.1 uncharacterized protein DUF3127 [Marinoscillum furvescens DSM 4134]